MAPVRRASVGGASVDVGVGGTRGGRRGGWETAGGRGGEAAKRLF